MRWSLVVLAACGSRAAAPCPTPPKVSEPIPQGALAGKIELAASLSIHLAGSGVPLAELPVSEMIGLPMSGAANVRLDLDVPGPPGHRDYSRAKGTLDFACPDCRIGDDRVVKLAGKSGAFAQGVALGHIELGTVVLQATAENGHARIAQLQIASKDMAVEVALDVALAPELGDGAVTGCVRFKPFPALQQRDAKMYSLLQLIGALLTPDGMFNITISGKVSEVKLKAQACSVSTSGPKS